MRELLFKNMTTWKNKKRDIFVEEIIDRGDIRAKTTKRCLYFIKDKIDMTDPSNLKNMPDITAVNTRLGKHFFVLKEHNTDAGLDKLMCKAAGRFYAMSNNYLYCIAFVHIFKVSFLALKK